MAGQIKGITIEFDGDTTRLETALRKVKSEANTVDSALKDVNRQLKFDPKNTELLGQRQTLLKQKIEGTKEALTKFRDIQKQLDTKNVDKTSAGYLRVRREIIAAEGKLKAFNAQLAKAKFQGMKNLGQTVQGVGQKLTRATRYARMFVAAIAGAALYKGIERLKSLDEVSKQMEVLGYRGEKLDKIMEDVGESVSGTRFMLQDMGKVAVGALGSGVTEKYDLNDYLTRTADLAQLAGVDVQSMGAMLNKAYSKGKVDAKIMNQLNAHGIPIYKLMQKELGVTAEELQDMSKKGKLTFDDLYKATSKYEGLAEKMGTETLPGALTVLGQQFGLIGADFLEGVYEPLKSGVKGIVAAIKDLRKNGTFKQWGKDLGDTVKYFVEYFKTGETSMTGLSDRAQSLVTVLGPLVKTIGAVVEMLAGLPPQMQGFLVFTTLLGGPFLQAVGGAVTGTANLGANLMTMGLNAQAGIGPTAALTKGIGLMLNPVTLVTLAIAAWALGMKKAYDQEHRFTQGFEEWKKASDEQMAATETQNATIDLYKQKLDELMEKEEKSAADKELIKTYVDQLNGAIDGLNLKYDAENDKLNKTNKAIEKKIENYKKAALVKAFEDQITEAAKKEAAAQMELQKLYEKRDAVEKKWAETKDKSAVAEQGYKMALGDVNREIANAEEAMKQYDEEMNRAADAVETLSNTSTAEFKKSTDAAKREGSKAPGKYAAGIDDKEERKKIRKAAKKAAKAATDELDVNTKKLGQDFADGFSSGIMSRVRDIADAAKDMVQAAIEAAKKEQDSGSPSKIMRKVGEWYGQGYALGIQDEAVPVLRSAHNLVAGAIHAATIPANGSGLTSTAGAGGTKTFTNYFTINASGDAEAAAYKIATILEQEARAR